MLVHDLAVASEDGAVRASARVDDFELWFRFEAPFEPRACADAFVAAALMPAMRRGADLELDPGLGISPRLVGGLGRLQEIWPLWFPELRRVSLRARAAAPPPPTADVALFFSGGVDSAYTYLEREAELTRLVWFAGMDVRLGDRALWQDAERRAAAFARRAGKPLTVVSTNARELMRRVGLTPDAYHGSLLAAIALMLGARRVHVAASFTHADRLPWGSHPLTDPAFSTESCEIVHDGGDVRRSQKLRRVARAADLLRDLRVCLQGTVYNCGRCEKCLRTMMTLRLLGHSSESLPPLRSLNAIHGLRLGNDAALAFWRDNYELAREVGDAAAAGAVRTLIRRYLMRRAFQQLARLYSDRWLARAYWSWRVGNGTPM